jgi:hypothetical protein
MSLYHVVVHLLHLFTRALPIELSKVPTIRTIARHRRNSQICPALLGFSGPAGGPLKTLEFFCLAGLLTCAVSCETSWAHVEGMELLTHNPVIPFALPAERG